MRRTKIVATIGPASSSPDMIDKLIAAGRVLPGRVDIVESGIAIAVRKGARRWPVATEDDVRRAVQSAASLSFSTGPSGVYLAKLRTVPESKHEHAWQSYVIFIVRDERRADVLFQVSDNTWAAYNRWPDDYSLYTDPRHAWAPEIAVSFDRPYGRQSQFTGIVNDPLSVGSGEFLSFEQPLSYFLEPAEAYALRFEYRSRSSCTTPACDRSSLR